MDDQGFQIMLAAVALGLAAVGLGIALIIALKRMRTARIAVAGEFTQAKLDGLAVWDAEAGSRGDRGPGR